MKLTVRSDGYVVVSVRNRQVYEHRLIAETAIGRALDPCNQVHHFVGKDNTGGLVICEDDAYHKLLHCRQRVLMAGGNPDTDKICSRCKTPQPQTAFPKTARNSDGLNCYCSPCSSAVQHAKYRAKHPAKYRTQRYGEIPVEKRAAR